MKNPHLCALKPYQQEMGIRFSQGDETAERANRQTNAWEQGVIKLSDTMGMVLKSKDENRVLSVAPDQFVYQAIEKMAEHGIGALLVISDNRLVGILSERDYARKVILYAIFQKRRWSDRS